VREFLYQGICDGASMLGLPDGMRVAPIPEPSWQASFFVEGRPVPKGNLHPVCPHAATKDARRYKRCDRPFVTEDFRSDQGKRLQKWMETIVAASVPNKPPSPLIGAVMIDTVFFFGRPKSTRAPFPCTNSTGDEDKLLRGVFDALQVASKRRNARVHGVMFEDDCQAVGGFRLVRWGLPEGVWIRVSSIEAQRLKLPFDS